MSFEIVDGYLLGEPVAKAAVVAALLSAASERDDAAPFARALEAVGVRAADEAFLALRLVLAGKPPSDTAVRRLRAFSAVARACAQSDGPGLERIVARDRAMLSHLPLDASPSRDLQTLGRAAKAAYYAELEA